MPQHTDAAPPKPTAPQGRVPHASAGPVATVPPYAPPGLAPRSESRDAPRPSVQSKDQVIAPEYLTRPAVPLGRSTVARSPLPGAPTPSETHLHAAVAQATAGPAIPLPHRAHLEGIFQTDLSGLRAYLAEPATLRGVGAEALSRGDDVVFSSSRPDVGVAAHEVAHALQRRGGPQGAADVAPEGGSAELEASQAADAARDGLPMPVPVRHAAPAGQAAAYPRPHPQATTEVRARYRAFVSGVFAAARHIVTSNQAAVEQWRTYTLQTLSPRAFQGQAFATGFDELLGLAQQHRTEWLLPQYANEPNPIRQSLLEHQIQGQWTACTGCHVSNQAWQLDADMKMAGNIGRTPAELLADHAGFAPLSSARTRREALSSDPLSPTFLTGDRATWDNLFTRAPTTPQQLSDQEVTALRAYIEGLSGASTTTTPAPSAPTTLPSTPTRPSAPVPTAARRSEIPVQNGNDALRVAEAATATIDPQLHALGSSGYKILPDHVISRFGQAPAEALRSEVEANFERRLTGYARLLERINDQRIDYLEFDALVASLKPNADAEVRALVALDEQERASNELATMLGLLVLDLVSIVLPPVGIVAGIAHMAHGAHTMDVGTQRDRATGLHGLMSPGRQASGGMMQMLGAFEVLMGALQAGTAASSMLRPAQGAGGGALTRTGGRPLQQHTQGPVTVQELAGGGYRVTHADFPGRQIVVEPGGSFQAFDELGNLVGAGRVTPGGGAPFSGGAAPSGSGLVPYGTQVPGPWAPGYNPAAPYAFPTTPSPLLLSPGNPTTLSLSQVRNLRGPERWQAGEQYIQELYGSPGQQHFPVPVDPSGPFPVTGAGGRFVDAPAAGGSGQLLAGEVKTYQRWITSNGTPTAREVPLSPHITEQIHKDVWLRQNVPGYDPRWMFLDAPPSPALIDKLREANITWIQYN